MNMEHANFRVFAPDELDSNRLGAMLEVTNRAGTPRPTTTTTISPRTVA